MPHFCRSEELHLVCFLDSVSGTLVPSAAQLSLFETKTKSNYESSRNHLWGFCFKVFQEQNEVQMLVTGNGSTGVSLFSAASLLFGRLGLHCQEK